MFRFGQTAFSRYIQKHYNQWLDKRIPPTTQVRLTQKNIFIFPVRLSLAYITCVAVLWIAATNYENNLAFAMCFLLLSVYMVCILHTFNNLSGLKLTRLDSKPVFAGELAECTVMITANAMRNYQNIYLGWQGNQTRFDLKPGEKKKMICKVPAPKRGYYQPGRLAIETVYPLGILRSWSYINLDFRILVYPKPKPCDLPALGMKHTEEGEQAEEIRGGEEYNSLKDYYPGAPLKHLAWKQYAKGRGLHVKDYSEYVDRQLFFDWEKLPFTDVEEKLSALCFGVIEAEKRGECYGIRIPGFEKSPDSGALHASEILKALALFGEPA